MNNIVSLSQAQDLWIHSQKLNEKIPFGLGPKATTKAVEHLGYVQIDTISVVERCHHHILFTRIPQYKKEDLHRAQTFDKTVFEYWTHALAYVPTKDFRFFMNDMKRRQNKINPWYSSVKPADLEKMYRLIKKEGAISIRDIEDEVLVEKAHPWASKKPSKKVLQLGFHIGKLVVSERVGMLKKYELIDRHFNWIKKPKAASEKDVANYYLERALRAQGIVSLDSICYLNTDKKAEVKKRLETKIKKEELISVTLKGFEKIPHYISKENFEFINSPQIKDIRSSLTHILSPFDPLIIQRKRLQMFFGYEHRFEAYVPKAKRKFGYFALPVLLDNKIVAAIDLKADRAAKKLLIQQWTWVGKNNSASAKKKIESELHRFEKFQLA